MKKILTLGMTTALLATSLMGGAAFADATTGTTEENINMDLTNSTFEYESGEDFLKIYKDILSKEDFELLKKYDTEIEAAYKTESETDDDVAYAKFDKLLEKYDSKLLKAEETLTSKEFFKNYATHIKDEDKGKIETLLKTLEKYRAAGDVANYDKTFDKLENLLPEFDDEEGMDFDDSYEDIDKDYIVEYKKILSKEDFALFEKYEKELESAFEKNDDKAENAVFEKLDKLLEKYESDFLKAEETFSSKEIFELFGNEIKAEDKSKIETLAKTLETYRANGDVKNYEKTFDELEKFLPAYEDTDDATCEEYTPEELYSFSDKELSANEKKEIESLHNKIIELEKANKFDEADKVYEELDKLLFD